MPQDRRSSGIRQRLLTGGTLLLISPLLLVSTARAEDLPAPEPLPDGAIAPIHQPSGARPALLSPVHSPDGGGTPLIAPLHGPRGEWHRQRTQEGEQLTLTGAVHFAKNEAVLSPTARAILDELATSWETSPPPRVTVVGHTDTDGDAAENQDLSESRARAVADHLSQLVPSVRFEVSGKGEAEPLRNEQQGTTEERTEAKDANRRVVITALDD